MYDPELDTTHGHRSGADIDKLLMGEWSYEVAQRQSVACWRDLAMSRYLVKLEHAETILYTDDQQFGETVVAPSGVRLVGSSDVGGP
jgi:hypothetical protein